MRHDTDLARTHGFQVYWLAATCAALLFALMLCYSPSVMAQGPTPGADQVIVIAQKLYCPLCQGLRLSDCELQVCEQMRRTIAEKLAAGESEEQIIRYFVEQYGEQVLGAPPKEGFNLLVWVIPLVILVGGLGVLFMVMRGWTARRQAIPVSPAPATDSKEIQAEYLRQLEEDLKKLE
jgi:cytochrome c-type biogenesis protein CcmH